MTDGWWSSINSSFSLSQSLLSEYLCGGHFRRQLYGPLLIPGDGVLKQLISHELEQPN